VKKLLWLLLAVSGCGGKKGTLALSIVVSPTKDPFTNAANVKFTIGDANHVKTVPVSNGHFDASIEIDPLSTPGAVTIEAFDASNNLIAHGKSPILTLQPINQTVAIWVGRPGDIAPANAALPRPLAEFAAANSPGLGIVIAGGRTTDGKVVAETSIYDVLTQSIIPPQPTDPNDATGGIPPLKNARAGAVAGISMGQNVVVMGGSGANGFGANGMRPSTVAESFSPQGSYGNWSSLQQPAPVGSFAEVTTLGSGNTLATGGLDENNNRLDTAALLIASGTTALNALSTPMAAPRAGHAVSAVKFPEGEGALVVGGLAAASTGPVAERLVGQSFSAYDVPGLENRIDATATTLSNGSVLVLGGAINGVAVSTGVLIDPSTTPPGVTMVTGAMSSARADHTANLVGDDVLVCGGVDETGKNVPNCDLVSGTSLTPKSTLPLADARHGHLALALETDLIVILGGFNDAGQPLPSIEIYTE
jgi:hypothetical protein